ncbi:MAG: polysaccharide deacetylase family protein, partial [Myxococcota bacterium]
MFHGIQPEPSPLTISKEELASILEALKTNGYGVAPLAEVMAARPEDKVAALTFDNGFRSVLEAAEVLADFRATATLFVVTGWVGKTNR